MSSQTEEPNTPDEKPAKKSYSSPRLITYGNFRDLTQAGAMGASNDGMANKTA